MIRNPDKNASKTVRRDSRIAFWRTLAVSILLLALWSADGQTAPEQKTPGIRPLWSADEILIRLKKPGAAQTPPSDLDAARQTERLRTLKGRHALRGLEELSRGKQTKDPKQRTFRALLPTGATVGEAVARLRQDPEIEWAEPNYYRYLDAVPNDPLYTHQTTAVNAIHLPAAWDISTGSREVIVAVIDSGMAWEHPDLAANLWTNRAEIEADGIDNDANGFIDDVHGWDFVTEPASGVKPGEDPGPPDNDPSDFFGHGTHVAGIIGGHGNNGQGIAGVAWQVTLLPLRAGFVDPSGHGILADATISEALHYACDNGADIVNMSFSAPSSSYTLLEALDYCTAQGVLMIGAAGNESSTTPTYPASYEPVVAVTSVNGNNVLSSFANRGPWIDLAAPGENIFSTLPPATYGSYSGTSMAAPMASGVAALIKATHPFWSFFQIRQQLLASANDISGANPGFSGMLGSGLMQTDQAVAICTDLDTDGFFLEGGPCGPTDCDDTDPQINPTATDLTVDGVDQNCDGADGVKEVFSISFPAIKDGPHSDGLWKNFISIQAKDPSVPVNVIIRLYNSDGSLKFQANDVTPVNGRLVKTPNWIMFANLAVEAFDGTVVVEAEAPILGMTNTIAPNEEGFNIYESPSPRTSLFFPAAYDNFANGSGYQNILHLQNINPTPATVTVEYIHDFSGTVTDVATIPAYGEYEKNVRVVFGGGFNGTIRVTTDGASVGGMLRYEYLVANKVEAMTLYEATVERSEIYLPYLYDGFGGNKNFIATMNISTAPVTCNYDFYQNAGDTGSGPVFSTSQTINPGARFSTTPSYVVCGAVGCTNFTGSMVATCNGNVVSTTNFITTGVEGFSIYEAADPKALMVFPQIYDNLNGYANEVHVQNPSGVTIAVGLELYFSDGTLLGTTSTTIGPYGTYVMRPYTINTAPGGYQTNGSLTVRVTGGALANGVMSYTKPTFFDVYEAVAP